MEGENDFLGIILQKVGEAFYSLHIHYHNEGSCTFIHYQMNDSYYGLIMVIHHTMNQFITKMDLT